jgi:alkylation response protein AidB-like acyl-CoA dehydrogenase
VAKAYVGDSAIQLGQNCFQVFSGIGFTWEHDHHLYLRRLTMDAALYGDPAWHRTRLARFYGLPDASISDGDGHGAANR